ncbi:MAG: succinate dehydrogenase, hydrophobic membrane anchor protein [Thiobacillus sp. 65-29]|jgi:succinate dehydrogenase / fumarate reductase membrane anchor subunit|nr:MAG: succinate dehydrogenase, hydrophobic membrane anchor protein [Thiobacillus sp. 65-29]
MKIAAGSHTGTGTWLVQRATAVVLALALPVLGMRILLALPVDFVGWRALFQPVAMRVACVLAAAALALHAWVGLRDVLMDYVRPTLVRLILYLVVIVTLAGSVAALAATLWSLP